MPVKYAELDLGTRVVFPEGYECFPHYKYTERLEGQVVSLHDDFVIVKLDKELAELAEWDNSIHALAEPEPDDSVPGLELLNN